MANEVAPGKVAVITGAGRGLGRTLAGFLAKQGYGLLLTARGEEELKAAAQTLRDAGSRVVAIGGDVSLPAHRQSVINAANAWGRIDLLVNNASELGGSPPPNLGDASRGTLFRVFDVNVFAPLALVQEALPLLAASHALVVNVSSDAAIGGYPGWGVYGSSKAALDLITKTLAAELKERGVAVVSVDPGDMRTKMHQDAYPGQDISDRPLPEVTLPFWAWLLSQDPMTVTGMRFQAQAPVWEVPA